MKVCAETLIIDSFFLFSVFFRIYLALKVQCQKENDTAITEEDGITVSCPLISHSLIDDVSVTISESTLDRQSQYYGLLAYLQMLYETTPRQKESYLRFFEGYKEDEGETYVQPRDAIEKGTRDANENEKTNTSTSAGKNNTSSSDPPSQTSQSTPKPPTKTKPTWTARNGRGRRTLRITNKQQQEYFCSLSHAFLQFDSLLPSNLEIGVRIYLTSYEKYFTTTNAAHRPTFKILDAKLLVEFILLKPNLLRAMETRLARSFLQINFLAKFVKSYSIEIGILERRLAISTRDPVSNILIFIQPNTV